MKYKGLFTPTKPEKYSGDVKNIIYRSGWELGVMMWIDKNSDVIKWGSEEIKVPYRSPIDNRIHRYFIDFNLTFKDGSVLLVELKPERQCKKPVKTQGKRRSVFLNEVRTYAVNRAKWEYAEKFAQHKNWKFKVWTEKTLEYLNIAVFK